MGWLVFFIYLAFFCWLITRIRFIRNSKLSRITLITLFVIKIAAGIAYFQFHSLPAYKERSDTIRFHRESISETRVLKTDPLAFFADFFSTGYADRGELFADKNSYWNDLKDAVIIKLMAVINLFTNSNYYANIIFFNFLFFVGLIAFYRLTQEVYGVKPVLLAAAIFLVPSFLFWCSGIHKDGLIFSAIGVLLYCFQQAINKQYIFRNVLIIVSSLFVIFLLRNYLFLLLLPCLLVGWLIHQFPLRTAYILLAFIVIGSLLVFTAKHIHPSLNIPYYIVDKQHQFKSLEGVSSINTKLLEPTFSSFIKAFPSALDMGFLRPHPTEKGFMSVVAFAEILVLWLVVLSCIIFRKRNAAVPGISWTCWCFALLVLIIIGYTIHFSGAVVRYRSLVLPLMLVPAVGLIGRINIIKKNI